MAAMLGEDLDQIAIALRELDEAQRRTERELRATRAQLDELVRLLQAREALGPGHGRHLDAIARRAEATPARKVRLGVYVDKYTVEHGEPVDCAARLHLCRAKCCSFHVELSQQDLEEGKLRWDLLEPYVLLRGADGYCRYLDRDTGRCTTYDDRPAGCRVYSCVRDQRVWTDFERMIPAPPIGGGEER
jgi:hypothetical protein